MGAPHRTHMDVVCGHRRAHTFVASLSLSLSLFFFFFWFGLKQAKTTVIWSYSGRNTCFKKKVKTQDKRHRFTLFKRKKTLKCISLSLFWVFSPSPLSLSNPCSQTHGSIPPSLLKLTDPISLHGMVMYFCIQYSLYYLLLLLNWYMFTIIWKNMLGNI